MDMDPSFSWGTPPPEAVSSSIPPQPEMPRAHPSATASSSSTQEPRSAPRPRRRYGPRTCRICLDVVEAAFDENGEPSYVSDDAELGRLISPCKCKGSQKYVHEGCLQAWRVADPNAKRNYWQCPTCSFTYRIGRISWARWLGSNTAQLALTLLIVFAAIFLLGFVADPIISMWTDPFGTIADTVVGVVTDPDALAEPEPTEPSTWLDHIVKGFFSLGVIGFLKFMASPWHWWNMRGTGGFGGGRRPGPTGRARVENVSTLVVIVGALTFLYGVWKAVRAFSRRTLQKASDRVMDVGEDDDDDEEEVEGQEGPEEDRKNI